MEHAALPYVLAPGGRLRVAMRHAQSAEEVAADPTRLLRPQPRAASTQAASNGCTNANQPPSANSATDAR
jgi:hypothetical protein